MQLGLVVGTATATVKHASMAGQKLMVVQPLLADGRAPDGDPVLAIDGVGAGRGETVMITSDGRGAREILGTDITPVRWSIIGIRDEVNGSLP
jgi:ethanolamine utilization protein EutN